MSQTIYASFDNSTNCEQAAGALLDYGVRKEDISLVGNETFGRQNSRAGNTVNTSTADTYRDTQTTGSRADSFGNRIAEGGDRAAAAVTGAVGAHNASANYEAAANQRAAGYVQDREAVQATDPAFGGTYLDPSLSVNRTGSTDDLSYGNATVADRNATAIAAENEETARRGGNADIEGAAKQGISVTTGEDAAAGAAKGAGWGLGLGILGGLAALAIPGVGLVVGGGALATAIGAALGTTVAGAAAGGVVGYFKDQGVPHEVATNYENAVRQGGAVLAVQVPSGKVDATVAQEILSKYGAANVNAY